MSVKNKKRKIEIAGVDSTQLATEIITALKKDKMYEQGKMISDISLAYMEMINEINAAYIEKLNEMLTDFRDLDKEEKIGLEKFDMDLVKAKLGVN